jgi:diketogulonate reductase-like aldo/keto reductase
MEICGKKVSRIGLGTWKIGGGFWMPDKSRDKENLEIIKYAIEKGITLIDTAEMYGGGHSEELVGEAVGRSEDVVIITKVWPSHLRYEQVKRSAHESLKRLKRDYIDLYMIHWPNPEVPLQETVGAMKDLMQEGIVKCIGVSNFSVDLLEEALKLAKIEANEIEYNPLHLEPERDVIPYCESKGIKVIAYSPLAQGRILRDQRLLGLAKKYGKTPAQIALNYVSKRSFPIPKASRKEHVDEIASSLDFQLKDEIT